MLVAVWLILSLADRFHELTGSIPAAALLSITLAGIKTVAFFHSQDLLQGCFPVNAAAAAV
ncbi:MAG: hypothetical protein AB1427_11810 [Thermodesulfobacteriota bacterium]